MNILMFSGDPRALEPGSDTRRRLTAYARVLGTLHVIVRTERAGRMQRDGSLSLYPASPRTILGFVRAWHMGAMLCRSNRYDAISVQAPDVLGCIGWLLALRMGVPLQLQLHTDYLTPRYRRASWKERIHYVLARFLIPRAACVRAVSERIRRSIRESGIRNKESGIAVLPIYTDISKFLDAQPDAETERRFAAYDFKMVAAGRFVEKEKNFSLLIDVMRDFVRIAPRSLLIIAGDGPDRKQYESRIRSYGLEKNIILEPWRDDLPSFLKSFDLYLLSSNYEGWNRGVVEAMAAGLAIVMTDVGLAGEVVRDGENGRVVPPGSADAMRGAIAEMYRDPGRRAALAAAGQRTAREMRPETEDEYLALYKRTFVSCGYEAGNRHAGS